jgi:hypothetical protein
MFWRLLSERAQKQHADRNWSCIEFDQLLFLGVYRRAVFAGDDIRFI